MYHEPFNGFLQQKQNHVWREVNNYSGLYFEGLSGSGAGELAWAINYSITEMNKTLELQGGRKQAQLLAQNESGLSVNCTSFQDVRPPGLAGAPRLPLQDVGGFPLQRVVDVLLQIFQSFLERLLQGRQR